MRTSEYKGDPFIMDFAGSSLPRAFSDDDSDVDAYDFQLRGSCSFDFHPEHPQSQYSPSSRKERVFFNEKLISLIENKMKDHNDKVLHAVEGFGARLSQLDIRTRQLENAVEDIKESLEYNHGKTDGKLRELENLLREVQSCTQDLRDKEDIAQAQLQILQLQIGKALEEKKENSTLRNLGQQKAAAKTLQSTEPLPVPVVFSQQSASSLPYVSTYLPHFSASTITMGRLPQLPLRLAQYISPFVSLQERNSQPPTLPLQNSHQQNHAVPVSHLQPTPSVPYFPSSPAVPYPSEPVPTPKDIGLPLPYSAVAPQSNLHDKYHKPLTSHSHLAPQGPPHLSSPSLQFPSKPALTSQDFGLPLPHNLPSAQPHHEPTHDPNELPYMPSLNYPQSNNALPGMPFLSSHQLQSPFTKTYDKLQRGPYSELLGRYTSAGGSSNFNNVDPRGGYNPEHGNSSAGTSSPSAPGIGNGYSQLPVARILPDALPTAEAVGPESSSRETRGYRPPMDVVIDKAVSMGFRRDLVRATANRLEAKGQHPDLNLLLDTLVSAGDSRG